MCLIAFAWKAHADYRLIVAANRDEWLDRPAAPAGWWDDCPGMLAGRDLRAGGTWLGITRGGRFAALTNHRDPSDRKADAPSRGHLVSGFLASEASPRDYLDELRGRASGYLGFNLLLGDRNSLWCFSSRSGETSIVSPGVHALSNHQLDEPWPKVVKARHALAAALRGTPGASEIGAAVFDLLSDADPAPDDSLPDTGVGPEWERILSPALIKADGYGTRCSTAIVLAADGRVGFDEFTRDAAGAVTNHAAFAFSQV
jgi:uncharacterized protein with NRDE domain